MFTSARTRTLLRGTAALGLALSGLCAHADNLNPILGGGLGAMAGAFIGQSVGGRDGAMVGAAVGGIAGVGIASEGQHRQSGGNVGYAPAYRPAPVYGYREVERVTYYPAPPHGDPRHGWAGPERGWERHEAYRRDWEPRGGEYRGWEHHGWDRRD